MDQNDNQKIDVTEQVKKAMNAPANGTSPLSGAIKSAGSVAGGVASKVPVNVGIKQLSSKAKLYIYIGGGFVGLLLLASIVMLVISKRGGGEGGIIATGPTVTPGEVKPTSTPALINPSRYATDEKVLSIESALIGIGDEMGASDVREVYLSLPRIDFNISFNK